MNKLQQKLVPELRFPEFEKDKWVKTNLGSIGKPLMCKRIFKEQTTTDPNNTIPFFKIGTFGKEADAYIPIKLFKEYKEKYSFPNIGEILISASGTIGRLVVYDGADAYFQDSNIVWIENDETQIINSLLFYCYSTLIWQTSDGGVIKRLYNSNLKEMVIHFPENQEEQRKIANGLSSLDNIIKAETEKLCYLKDHKKGLLQQLFPVKGEAKPQFRFSEFKDDGDWKEKNISQVADYVSGKAHEKEISPTGKYKVVNSKFISTEGKVVKLSNSANCLAKIGDVLMVMSDIPNGKAFAKCFYVEADNLYTVNQRICKLTPINIDSNFLFYSLNRNSYFLSFNDGVKQTNLKNDDVLSCPLLIPKELKEQKKIADCLSSADALIQAQKTKIKNLKNHKKGLLQQLFPNSL